MAHIRMPDWRRTMVTSDPAILIGEGLSFARLRFRFPDGTRFPTLPVRAGLRPDLPARRQHVCHRGRDRVSARSGRGDRGRLWVFRALAGGRCEALRRVHKGDRRASRAVRKRGSAGAAGQRDGQLPVRQDRPGRELVEGEQHRCAPGVRHPGGRNATDAAQLYLVRADRGNRHRHGAPPWGRSWHCRRARRSR